MIVDLFSLHSFGGSNNIVHSFQLISYTLPETNSKRHLKKLMEKEDLGLLGPGLLAGAIAVSLPEGK